MAQAACLTNISGKSGEELSELDWPTLYNAILKLKPQHQTIVVLRFFEGMEFERIGRILGAKEGAIRVTLHRILERLRNHLANALGIET